MTAREMFERKGYKLLLKNDKRLTYGWHITYEVVDPDSEHKDDIIDERAITFDLENKTIKFYSKDSGIGGERDSGYWYPDIISIVNKQIKELGWIE